MLLDIFHIHYKKSHQRRPDSNISVDTSVIGYKDTSNLHPAMDSLSKNTLCEDFPSPRNIISVPATRAICYDDISYFALTPTVTPSNVPLTPFYQKSGGSTVSLASSSSEVTYSNLHTTRSRFTPQFISLMLDTYNLVCSDFSASPFDFYNPPSGILSRVAKLTVERSEREGIEIGSEKNSKLLASIRQQILQEVKKDMCLSRNNSISPLPSVHQHYNIGLESNTFYPIH